MSLSPLEETTQVLAEARPETSRPTNSLSPAWTSRLAPYLLAAPHTLVLLAFLVSPILMIVIVSFWEYSNVTFQMKPAFTFKNYVTIFTSESYRSTFLNTFRFAGIVWTITLVIGFAVAYFLAFEIQTNRTRTALFLLCTVPFLTSNIIRSISWIPFLGRNGIFNGLLLNLGLISQPLDIFLFSDVAVIIALVHLYTLFMVVPIFNTMMRIDHSLIEAARDAGASWLRVMTNVVIPLSLPGIAIGTIFVVSLVLGDFMTVRLMSGGQAASVGLSIMNLISNLQYPLAAANAVILLLVTLMLVGVLLRLVDIKKEL